MKAALSENQVRVPLVARSFRNHHGLGAEREESSGRRDDRERIILELKERRCRSAESTGKRNNGIEKRALSSRSISPKYLGWILPGSAASSCEMLAALLIGGLRCWGREATA